MKPNKLKILQVVGSLNTGGAEMMVLTAAEALVKTCTMHFLVFEESEGSLESRAVEIGSQVIRTRPASEVGPWHFLKNIENILVEGQYDAVHCHIHPASGLIMKAAKNVEIPIRITHSHIASFPISSFVYRLQHTIAKIMVARYSTVYAACGEEAGRALFGEAWASGPSVVIPNAIPMNKFNSLAPRRTEIRRSLGLDDSQRVVGMVARLAEQKNHDFMLRVIAKDLELGGEALLLIVGDGPLRSSLEKRVDELGIESKVMFLGLRKDIPELLAAMDVFAMSSLWEGLPVALVEAQAAGLPVVVSDSVAKESDLGLGLLTWLPLGDVKKWCDALYFQPDIPTRENIQSRFDEAGYSIESAFGRMLALYR